MRKIFLIHKGLLLLFWISLYNRIRHIATPGSSCGCGGEGKEKMNAGGVGGGGGGGKQRPQRLDGSEPKGGKREQMRPKQLSPQREGRNR